MTFVICCAMAAAIAVPVARQSQSTPANDGPPPRGSACHDLPRSVRIELALRPIVMEMCRRSPSFRRQLARLSAQPALEVTVTIWHAPRGEHVRAVTHLGRTRGDLQAAAVRVRVDQPDLVVEHVAHEFEHIMEQLDGIDLGHWAGRSGVYRVESGDLTSALETARARYVGRMVAAEYAAHEGTPSATEPRP